LRRSFKAKRKKKERGGCNIGISRVSERKRKRRLIGKRGEVERRRARRSSIQDVRFEKKEKKKKKKREEDKRERCEIDERKGKELNKTSQKRREASRKRPINFFPQNNHRSLRKKEEKKEKNDVQQSPSRYRENGWEKKKRSPFERGREKNKFRSYSHAVPTRKRKGGNPILPQLQFLSGERRGKKKVLDRKGEKK